MVEQNSANKQTPAVENSAEGRWCIPNKSLEIQVLATTLTTTIQAVGITAIQRIQIFTTQVDPIGRWPGQQPTKRFDLRADERMQCTNGASKQPWWGTDLPFPKSWKVSQLALLAVLFGQSAAELC